jgi:hypothetical protein
MHKIAISFTLSRLEKILLTAEYLTRQIENNLISIPLNDNINQLKVTF